MSLMSDQLLKAGLVTNEQVEKAKKPTNKQKTRRPKKTEVQQNRRPVKKITRQKQNEQSDLEKFYKIRAREETREKQEALRKKKEAAQRKKEMNKKINALISTNILNDENADIRYNFVVGTTIKYLFVTEKQQEQLANGQLSISFLGGKRCLIPTEIGKQILEINPGKIVIS